MRPTEEIARDIVEHANPGNLRSLVTGLELVELAKEMLFWRDRFNRGQEQHDELRRENQRHREALRAAEQERDEYRQAARVEASLGDEARAEAKGLRDALRLAETTRNAAQAVASRETELRREVEAQLEKALAAIAQHQRGHELMLRGAQLTENAIEAARIELGAHDGETVTHAAFRCANRIADLRHALDGDDEAARRAMREQLVDVVENERAKRHTVVAGDEYGQGKADGYRWCAEEILRRLGGAWAKLPTRSDDHEG